MFLAHYYSTTMFKPKYATVVETFMARKPCVTISAVTEPTQQELEKLRQQGFRPEVVACFIFDRKVLFVYKKDHHLWQLPQGGIEPGETPAEAIKREMAEELGDFAKKQKLNPTFVGQDQIEAAVRKTYFFYAIESSTKKLDISKTEFNDYLWAAYPVAKTLAGQIYQKNKARITSGCLEALHNMLIF